MRGITEDKLKRLCKRHAFINFLLSECAELNAWMPIETAPKDRNILAYDPGYGHLVVI